MWLFGSKKKKNSLMQIWMGMISRVPLTKTT